MCTNLERLRFWFFWVPSIVTADQVVLEKDLGPNTTKLEKAISKDTPDLSWHLAE
jgi:hypothetical protein